MTTNTKHADDLATYVTESVPNNQFLFVICNKMGRYSRQWLV